MKSWTAFKKLTVRAFYCQVLNTFVHYCLQSVVCNCKYWRHCILEGEKYSKVLDMHNYYRFLKFSLRFSQLFRKLLHIQIVLMFFSPLALVAQSSKICYNAIISKDKNHFMITFLRSFEIKSISKYIILLIPPTLGRQPWSNMGSWAEHR